MLTPLLKGKLLMSYGDYSFDDAQDRLFDVAGSILQPMPPPL
jgi:hypothetical protein